MTRSRYGGSSLQIEGNTSIVNPGDDLQAAYDALKSSTNDGSMGALSATNWRTLLLSPGTYDITTQLDFDTDYVGISGIADNPLGTILEGAINGSSLAQQTCDVISMANLAFVTTLAGNTASGFWIRGCDNSLSLYKDLYFASADVLFTITPCCAVEQTDFRGTWENCIGSDYSFRITGRVDGDPVVFAPHMTNCHSFDVATKTLGKGTYSFGGDGYGPLPDSEVTPGDTGVIMKGTYLQCTSGDASFSGCASFSVPIHADALFVDCEAGNNSFGIGTTVAGRFRNCNALGNSFGSNFLGNPFSEFSGVAVNCENGESLDFDATGFGSGSGGRCSGRLTNCRSVALGQVLRIEGAEIDGCSLKNTETNGDCLEIIDSLSKVYNSTLVSNGTGNGIAAGSALSVVSAHNRMNVTYDANVTNLVTTPYDVIDANID